MVESDVKIQRKYIDIGANLTKFSDHGLQYVLKEAREADVNAIIVTGCDHKGSIRALDIVEKFGDFELYCTAGVHPHHAKEYNDEVHKSLEEMHKNPKVIAVGECGLDYNRMYSSKEDQIRCFRAQIEMAIKFKKPMFLHDREAFPDFANILEEYVKKEGKDKVFGVVHCFTGTEEEVKRYVELGFYIGITGWICDKRRNGPLLKALKYIPIERLMIETDAPFLHPLRKGRNFPKNVGLVLERLAQELKMDSDELAKICYENTKQLFSL